MNTLIKDIPNIKNLVEVYFHHYKDRKLVYMVKGCNTSNFKYVALYGDEFIFFSSKENTKNANLSIVKTLCKVSDVTDKAVNYFLEEVINNQISKLLDFKLEPFKLPNSLAIEIDGSLLTYNTTHKCIELYSSPMNYMFRLKVNKETNELTGTVNLIKDGKTQLDLLAEDLTRGK